MFETDVDFDLNDDIFNISGECSTSTQKQNTVHQNQKRHTECNVPQSNKKVCTERKAQISTTESFSFAEKSKLLLEKIRNSTFVLENSEKHDCSQPILNKRVVERCFPGPAGLLSPRTDCVSENSSMKYSDLQESLSKSPNEDILCSQTSVIAFKSPAWQQAINDFKIRRNNFTSLPEKYNIAWIKSKSRKGILLDQKAPFLAAIVQNVECAKAAIATVTVLLKDLTGEIEGTVQPDIYEKYISKLIPGAILVLKQFSVLTTNFGKNHHLTITPNNLIRIYVDEKDSKFYKTSSNHVKIIDVQTLSADDIYDAIEEARKTNLRSFRRQNVLQQSFNDTNVVECFSDKDFANCIEESLDTSNASISSRIPKENVQNLDKSSLISNCDSKRFNFKQFKNTNNIINADLVTFTSKERKQCAVFENNNFDVCQNRETEMIQNTDDVSERDVSENGENTIICSQISIKSENKDEIKILQSVFAGLDAESFFEDF